MAIQKEPYRKDFLRKTICQQVSVVFITNQPFRQAFPLETRRCIETQSVWVWVEVIIVNMLNSNNYIQPYILRYSHSQVEKKYRQIFLPDFTKHHLRD